MAMRGLVLPISGDARSLLRSFKQSEHAAQQFSREISKTGVSAKQSAQLQVQAAVKTQARLRQQIGEYKQLANTAQRGSREQVAAAHLAARAQGQLAKSIGTTTKEAREFARVSQRSQRHLFGGARGAVAGTGAVRGLGRSLAFAGGGFLAGFSATTAIKAVISQASILQEETEKTGVLFGRSEKQVQRWSRTLASSFGISEEAALQSAGVFGNIFRSLHFGEQPAAKMSERLVQLAADMASFNNASPEETLKALQSGLAGQVRPLRAYGVFLSQDRIKAEALSSGIAKNASHLTAAQKVQAAYNIILRDTALQHGDVARNTESLSVSQSKLKANLADSEAIIGRALLPSLVQLANGLSTYLNRLNRTGQLQRSVNSTVRVARSVFAGVRAVIVPTAHALMFLSHAIGGAKNVAKLFTAAFLAMKVLKWAAEFRTLAAAIRGVAVAEAVAAGTTGGQLAKANTAARLLALRMAALSATPWVITAYIAYRDIKNPREILDRAKKLGGIIRGGGAVERGLESLPTVGPVVRGLHDLLAIAGKPGPKPPAPSSKPGQDTSDRRPGRAPGGAGAFQPIPHGTAGARRDTRQRHASLAYQMSLAQEQLAKDELTASTKDDRATLSRLAALTRQKIAKTKDLQQRTQLYQELGGYESQIAQLDNDAATKAKEARSKQLSALKQREQTLRGRIKDITSSFKEAVDTAREGIGELFSGPVLNPSEDVNKGILGVHPQGTKVGTLTADLRAQTAQYAREQADLARLKRRGASSQLLKELRAGGDVAKIHALATAKPGEFKEFLKQFGRREHLAIRTARTTMRAQLVTLHAARVQLRLTRGQERALSHGGGNITINVNGAHDSKKVARDVLVELQRATRRNAPQRSGRHAGSSLGIH